MRPKLTIGALARRCGVTVKALRFYSDQGLLPPVDRSRRGYRLYTEAHALRVDLIRSLRDAGIGLDDIGKVLRRDLSLEEVLTLRLRSVEAHIAGLERVASALRLALEAGATEAQLRRISMATRASNEERKQVIKAFYEKVVEGVPAPRHWVDGMIEASSPELPDTPTAEQIAAWLELEEIMADASFLACKRVNAEDMFVPRVDPLALADALVLGMSQARDARLSGLPPTSDDGRTIVEHFLGTLAPPTRDDVASLRAHFRTKCDPRGARYWDLIAILRPDPAPSPPFEDWRWFGEAMHHHVA